MKLLNLILAGCFVGYTCMITVSCGNQQGSEQEEDTIPRTAKRMDDNGRTYKIDTAKKDLQEQPAPPVQQNDENDIKTYKTIPTAREIEYDLIGHEISEGTPNGYHKSYWRYRIEAGELSNFRIDEVLRSDNQEYSIIASFNLKGGKNYYYRTLARISYDKTNTGWELESIFTLQMDFIVSDDYDFAIRREMSSNGYAMWFYNMTEDSYSVIGEAYDGGWRKFLLTLSPGNSDYVPGTDFRNIHVLSIK